MLVGYRLDLKMRGFYCVITRQFPSIMLNTSSGLALAIACDGECIDLPERENVYLGQSLDKSLPVCLYFWLRKVKLLCRWGLHGQSGWHSAMRRVV